MWARIAAVVLAGFTVETVYRIGLLHGTAFLFAQGTRLRIDSPEVIGLARWYTGGVLAILVAHECGHYVACKRRDLVTHGPFLFPLPLSWVAWSFIPAFGTAGAWLRVASETTLADRWRIAAAGILAGAVVTAIATGLGIWWSVPVETITRGNHWEPALFRWLVPDGVAWHPVLAAALFGWVLTAISLLPLPSMDGWHLLRGFTDDARQTRWWSTGIACLALACWVSW